MAKKGGHEGQGRAHADQGAMSAALEVLCRNRDFISTIMGHSMAQMAFLDTGFRLVWINESYAREAGRESGELIGRDYFEVFPQSGLRPLLEKALETGQPAEVRNKPYRRDSGEVAYWYETAIPVKSGGGVEGLALLRMDTTVQAKEKLRLERIADEWRSVFDSVPDFISIHDVDYNIVRVNLSLARALGREPTDLVGRKCYEVFHKAEVPWVDCPHRRMLETGETAIAEIYESNLGMYLEVIAAPIAGEDGGIMGSVHISRDITRRKKVEESLGESEEKYRDFTNMLPQIIFEMDADFNITFANRQALEMAGYSPEDFQEGLTAIQMLVPEYREQAQFDIMKSLQTQGSQQFEFTMRRKDGSTFPASVYINPVIRDGKVAGLAGIVIDLTEQKKLEQLKDEFIGMVSHELQTPLTAVVGSVNMVLNAGDRLTRRESRLLLRDAVMAGEELSNILGNLLELSRARADRLILHPETVDLKALIRGMVRRMKPRTAMHNFVTELPRQRLMVPADPVRMERILHNLIGNAIKYSPEGGEIRVRAEKDAGKVTVSVSDRGIGISRADQEKLFSSFRRLERLRTPGIGLGLMVCKRLVEAHHGRIWVESAPGQGSTFFFTIPLKGEPA